MKKFFKLAAVLMTLALVVGMFAACGGGSTVSGDTGAAGTPDAPDAPASVAGSTEEHGYYTVLVPEGYTLVHEDVFGDNNPDSFTINLEDSSFTYFMFSMYDADNAQSSIEITKEMNDGAEDVSVEYGGVTWTGVAYNSLGIDCFSLYGAYGENYVLVSGAGNAYDSEITSAVLGSLTVNVTE